MKQYSEHVPFIFALFDKPLPKRRSSNLWIRMRKRLRSILGHKSTTANVESVLAHASKLSLTISRSFNITQGPQLTDDKRNQLKDVLIAFLSNGCRISQSTSRPSRKKKELIRTLLRKTIEEWNRCLSEINGAWLQGYGHIYNNRGKPGLLDKFDAISLFNEFIDCHLISCKELRDSALAIKAVFDGGDSQRKGSDNNNKHRACSFKLLG